MKHLSLIALLLFLGAGCPQKPPLYERSAMEKKNVTEEKMMEKSNIPDDGLEAALEELDIVDTEYSGGMGGY